MKIRGDFVTNSSSSSFTLYRIDNKEMAKVFKNLGYWHVLSDFDSNVIKGRFDSEATDLTIPNGESITDWFVDSMEKTIWRTENSKKVINALLEHKDEIDHNCRSADIAVSVCVSDGDGSKFRSEERKGSKIILKSIDDEDWDYKKEGEGLWEFIAGDTAEIRRKAKEMNGEVVYDDPWLEKEDLSSIFDTPQGFSFKDQVVCLTGDFEYGSRKAVKAYIESLGGKVSSSVNTKTTVVFMGKKPSAGWSLGNYGTKIEKAIDIKKHGGDILIFKEKDEFFEPTDPSETIGEPIIEEPVEAEPPAEPEEDPLEVDLKELCSRYEGKEIPDMSTIKEDNPDLPISKINGYVVKNYGSKLLRYLKEK